MDETEDGDGLYVALSQCWGDEEHRPLTTTTKTLQACRKAIPLSKLPQTFLDAVLLTRNIGIKYLWIDSLSIVQDDKDDWTKESARMAEVYQGATLTISADGAMNSYEGLFGPVSKRSTARAATPIPSPENGAGSELYARRSILNVYRSVHAITSVAQDPLRCRAWALQEWLLSTRIVHFIRGELLWECKAHLRCECQIVSQSPEIDDTSMKRSSFGLSKTDFFPFDRIQEQNSNWYKIVEEFTKRRLTFTNDALPALSGLAKQISA